MSFALFLLLLSVPLGVLVTLSPMLAWGDAARERIALAPPWTPVSVEEPLHAVDSSHHPATCLATATQRAQAYLGFIAARWHLEDLDPMTWLIAGRLRDRFETSMLHAIGALNDWLGDPTQAAGIDARAMVERERLRETLGELIGSLPTFSVTLGWECHYRVEDLHRICARLDRLSAGVDRHRQVALHPPTAPFR